MALTDPAIDPAGTATDHTIARIARSGMWSMLAHVFSAGSVMAVSIIIGRSLGSAELGQYTFHVWIVRVVPIVLALGVPTALTRFISEKEGLGRHGEAGSLFRMVRRFHFALLVVPSAVLVGLLAMDRLPVEVAAVLIAGTAAGLLTLDYEALLTGLRRFRDLGLIAAVLGVSQVIAAGFGVVFDVDWRGFLAFFVAATTIGVLAMAAIGRRWLSEHESAEVGAQERKRFARFAWAVALAVTADAFLWGRPELLFLQRYRPEADLGLYSAALRLATLASMIPLVAARSLLPEFSFQQARGKDDEMRATFRQVCTLLVAVTAPLALGGAAVAWTLVTVVFGAEFEASGTATSILLAGSLVNALAGPSAAVILIGPRPRLVAEVGLAAIVFNAALDVALIPDHGPEGAAIANVIVQSLCVIVGIVYAWLRMGLRYPVAQAARVMGCAAASALLAAVIVRSVGGASGLVLAVVAAGVAYVALIVGSRTVDVGDLRRALLGRSESVPDETTEPPVVGS